jgi:hypothetical protein
MSTLPRRWKLFIGVLVTLAIVTTVAVLLLPTSATPFCQAEKALDQQGPTLSHKFSRAQFTNYVLTEAKLEANIAYTEPPPVRAQQLALAGDLRALASDPLYYQDLVTSSPPSPAVMFADPRYKKLLDADAPDGKIVRYISSHIPHCSSSS